MANPFLSGRIPAELNQQIDEFLARTGETKTEMLARAVAAYIGAEAPPLKATGDRRIENLEREVAELKGAVQSLYGKFATFTPKRENPKIEIEPITACDNYIDNSDNRKKIDTIDHASSDNDNTVDNNHNYVEIEIATTADNIYDNNDNTPEVSSLTDVTPTSDDEKTFISIDTAKAAKLTKLDPKKFTDLRGAFNRKLKKGNQSLPEKILLDSPIKMTPSSEVKIAELPYDIFYVGQSKEGKNLWNLVPQTTLGQEIPLPFPTDNDR